MSDEDIMYDSIVAYMKQPQNSEDELRIRKGITEGFQVIEAARRLRGPEAVTMVTRKKPARRWPLSRRR